MTEDTKQLIFICRFLSAPVIFVIPDKIMPGLLFFLILYLNNYETRTERCLFIYFIFCLNRLIIIIIIILLVFGNDARVLHTIIYLANAAVSFTRLKNSVTLLEIIRRRDVWKQRRGFGRLNVFFRILQARRDLHYRI